MANLITLQDGQVATVAPVNANFAALNTEVRGVPAGGSGAATLTAGGVLIGNGTNPITATPAGPPGSVLAVPDGGGSPSFRALQTGFYNMAFNGDFESWGNGPTAAPTGWSLIGAGMTAIKMANATRFKIGTASAQLARAGTDGYIFQDFSLFNGGVTYLIGRTVTAGCWVRATVPGRAFLGLRDGITGDSTSPAHSGGGQFEWLTVTRTIATSAKVEQV